MISSLAMVLAAQSGAAASIKKQAPLLQKGVSVQRSFASNRQVKWDTDMSW